MSNRKIMWTSLLGAALFAGAAAAQGAFLTADEIRAELFGVRLTGFNESSGMPWEECIEPSGTTRYRLNGVEQQGQLIVDDSGLACFVYGGGNASCFVVGRESGGNYRFNSFVTTRVERGVASCESGPAISVAPAAAAPAR